MAKKFYVVWKGRTPGIFTSWADCKAQVDQFTGARYKSFPTQMEAEQAFGKGSTTPFSGSARKPTGSAVKTGSTTKKKPKSSPLTDEKIAQMPYEYKIYTDGACEPNPGEAGAGMAVYRDNKVDALWYGMYEAVGTNNTAELNALHQSFILAKALTDHGKTVAIYSDSSYSIQCMTTWAKGWKAKGWKKSTGEIKNLELIKIMYALYLQIEAKIAIHHVNGHVGVEGNELADRMSILAIEAKEKDFTRFTKEIDVAGLLALRRG